MIPLLYQLSYTAPEKIRGLRYCIAPILSRKTCPRKHLDYHGGTETLRKDSLTQDLKIKRFLCETDLCMI